MTPLGIYKFIFLTELLISECLFLMRLKKAEHFAIKMPISIGLCYLFAWLVPIFSYNAFSASVMFLMIFAFVTLMMKWSFNESWRNIIFCSIAAYTVQHLAYGINLFFITLTGLDNGLTFGMYSEIVEGGQWHLTPVVGILYFLSYSVTYWLMFVLFADRIKKNEDLQIRMGILFVLVFLILIVDVVINVVIVYYAYDIYNKFYLLAGFLYNIICCLLTLTIQFEQLMQKQLKDELGTVYYMWHQEKKQFEMKKENIDLINLKCHDLKHQIRKIGKNTAMSPEAFQEIEDIISIYDSSVETGNKTLDIILTEKSLLCNQNNIELLCIADGKSLDFMNEIDLFTMFGNAIDNASEAVMQLDKEMRSIHLSVKRQLSGLVISIYNYYQEAIVFDNGLPETTKHNKDYHGFGLKSIQRVVDKYGGDLSIGTQDNVFTLTIYFPDIKTPLNNDNDEVKRTKNCKPDSM